MTIPVRQFGNASVTIRPLRDGDSLSELTELLHRAYKRLADMGLRFVASYQSEDVTRDRIRNGSCYVAVSGDTIVATVTVYLNPSTSEELPELYRRKAVARFGQFAVEPQLQKQGIGDWLLDFIEDLARNSGCTAIACDTSEQAHHLITYYGKRGYGLAGDVQWRVHYHSVILSKPLK